MSRISEIIKAEAEADRLQDKSDQWRWLAAELIAAELCDGKRQRQLADELGYRSHTTVMYKAKAWKIFGLLGDQRPSWNDAYHSPEVRGSREPTNPPDAITGDEPTNPPMTNAEARQLIRQATDAIPIEERAWDELRKANGSLIGFRDYLRLDVIPHGVIAEGTIEAFRELVSEIESHLERLS